MLVLGIDTSCDETAAALLLDGRDVLSSVVASQAIHAEFGGVVPEHASRAHIRLIVPIVQKALADAGKEVADLEAVAVTNRPGLVGCLLVGASYAKALAYALGVPVVGVDHIEAHVFAARLERPEMRLPAVVLVASGGHTELMLIERWGQYVTLGRTRDDAAGEAFDKVGKLLGLRYPAGPEVERLAAGGDPAAFDFPRAMMRRGNLDFSFSGLKTAVRYAIEDRGGQPEGQEFADFLASFQAAVVDALVTKTMWAAEQSGVPTVALGGGVAANTHLRERLTEEAARAGLEVVIPARSLCTDNGAVVAAVGQALLDRGVADGIDLDVSASREDARAGREGVSQ
jgi:N6-L-threonylcarbamoyladenine synthase